MGADEILLLFSFYPVIGVTPTTGNLLMCNTRHRHALANVTVLFHHFPILTRKTIN